MIALEKIMEDLAVTPERAAFVQSIVAGKIPGDVWPSLAPKPPGDGALADNPFSDLTFDPNQARDEKGRWARFAARGFAEPDAAERKQLGIPPAWKEVQISREPGAALLAVGLDAKGREQRVYSAAHHQQQAAAKFARIGKLHERLPEIDKRIEADAKTDDSALAALMIRRMGLRPGSDQNTGAEKKAHGATNLKASHVTVSGSTVRAAFIGKKGVELDLSLDDPLLARLIRKRKRGKGADDRLLDTDERKLRSYMKSAAPGVKPKDFRTYLATATAMELVAEVPELPHNEREYKTLRKEVAKKVSRLLGNTPTVALTSYISPEVFGSWDTAVDFSGEGRERAMIPSVERMHENVARLLAQTRYAPATKAKLDQDGMPVVEPDPDDPEEQGDFGNLAENPFSDLAYDPTQPRDEKGRWTGVGGGLASRSGLLGGMPAPPGVRDGVWDAWMRQTIERRGGPPAIPVSQHFMTAPRTSRHVKKELRNTLDAIDAVHADGLLPEVMVSEKFLGPGQEALYSGVESDTPHISLSKEGFVPETSLAHEIGHLLDHRGLGESQGPVRSIFDFATMADNDRRVSEVMDAINDTPEVRRLKTNDGMDDRVVFSGDSYASYLDRPYEKFARAYAQYIATKSRHPVLRNMMRQEQDESAYELLPRQWAPENFGAISEAFDALFRSKGWLNE